MKIKKIREGEAFPEIMTLAAHAASGGVYYQRRLERLSLYSRRGRS